MLALSEILNIKYREREKDIKNDFEFSGLKMMKAMLFASIKNNGGRQKPII